jgi:transposase
MLRPQPLPPIPDDTARIARAAFRKGHPYLRLADELGALFSDETFAALFPSHGQPALAPWRLAFVTILQFAEGLSDRQAADAVRGRIDWKYLLRLGLADAGFDASVLVEFRARLIAGEAEQLLLDTLLAWCRERQLLKARGRQRTDSTQVLAAVRALNRVELVGETVRHALNSLAVAAPAWLAARHQLAWADRSARRADDYHLPTKPEARLALAEAIGRDGAALLAAIHGGDAPAWLRELPAVETLRLVWIQQYVVEGGALRWRVADELPPAARFISSPSDLEAHYAKKRTRAPSGQWVGYKVHLTETCAEGLPPLITHVETTSAPVADGDLTPTIHAALKSKDLLPDVHIVDTGYLDAALLVTSRQEYGVDLLGPTRLDYHWQAREQTGFAVADFRIDGDKQEAICPAGHTSLSWTPAIDKRTNAVIKITFSSRDCGPCPCREHCTRSRKRSPRRTLTVRADAAYHALQQARERFGTQPFAAEYARRAGIEGTISRGLRRCGLRRARYIGLAKTALQHCLTAASINFLRIGEWLSDAPRARTRHSPYARLAAALA